MLELRDICKEYRVGDTVQKALDHVSLTLADTEFVAILGPSGSGKTTLLNIIGGLDRYDSGDLIIDGISTRNYSDRNWDSYRNRAVGFVFQNYNLIMHQSVLSNVELALTISGVTGEQRRQRAEEALRRVGLEDHMHKKPSQLSGGQMQRVAIARALVNNPRIVLADEPTGALDSETSIQVMNMLKEVSRDRLVVMVTHNPDLAEQYATRIVTIRDGHFAGSRDLPQNQREAAVTAQKTVMRGDSGNTTLENVGAYVPEENTRENALSGNASGNIRCENASSGSDSRNTRSDETAEKKKDSRTLDRTGKQPDRRGTRSAVKNGRFRRTSMNFLTALGLSFQNLRTKKARTFMVAFAGSIGIIGIALIMAIETGLQQYIQTTEKATLSQYPIEIYSTGIDWSSLLTEGYRDLFSTGTSTVADEASVSSGSDEIAVNPMAKNIFTGMSSNDLASFKTFLESGKSEIPNYATDIEYSYGIEPQIYSIEKNGTIDQLNPNRMLSDMLTSIIDVSSLMNGFVGESLFHAMPSDSSLYEGSYEVKAGRWPKNSHELVLVLTNDGRTSDFMLYELGILDPEKLREMIQQFSTGSSRSLLNLAQTAATAVGADNSSSTSTEDTESVSEAASSQTSETSDEAAGTAGTSSGYTASSSSDKSEDTITCTYDDFIGRTFKLILNSDVYTYDKQMKVWSSQAENTAYMEDLVKNGEDLKIVGIVQPKDGASNLMLTSGLGYPRDLIHEIIDKESQSKPVKAQLADPDTDIFTGNAFSNDTAGAFNLENLITLDHDDVAKAFHVNTDAGSSDTIQNYLSGEIDKISGQIIQYASQEAQREMSGISLSDFIDLNDLEKQLPQLSEADLKEILQAASASLSQESVQKAIAQLGEGYTSYLAEQMKNEDSRKAYEDSLLKIFQPMTTYIGDYLQSGDAQAIIQTQVQDMIRQNASAVSPENIQTMLSGEIQNYLAWVAQQNSGRGEDKQLPPDSPEVIQLYLTSPEGQQRITALSASLSQTAVNLSEKQLQQLADALAQSFDTYAAQNAMPDLSALSQDLARNLTESLTGYLQTEEAQRAVTDAAAAVLTQSGLQQAVTDAVKEKLTRVTNQVSQSVIDKITATASEKLLTFANRTAAEARQIVLQTIAQDYPQVADYINTNMNDFFTVNQDLFRQAIKVNAGVSELQAILTSFLNSGKATLAGNLTELGYADLDSPTEIMIYPADFNAKNQIANLIQAYNDNMKENGEKDKVITYSDIVATMMQSITDIINSISHILMAFVSISLVVSSIMIGVITYISVLERRKEIGILRAIGASRHNIREVFDAETVITGFLSGCMGVGITLALIPAANLLIRHRTGQLIRAALPPLTAAALVLLSILLTLLAGLIPSGQASRSDPVSALRSE